MTSNAEALSLQTTPNTPTARRYVVLIAESDTLLQRRLSDQLRSKGHLVFGCETVHRLARTVAEINPDVLVSELRLADGPSLDAIESLRQANPTLRVVVLTGHSSIATAVRCAKLGIEGYLPKPAWVDRILESALEQNIAARPSVTHPMTLDRAVWEYINRVVQESGSISHAANALQVDRRTLRRMLGKHTPFRLGGDSY